MSKRIIVCCDGTANSGLAKGAVPTNIQRISELVSTSGTDGKTQITYYHPGVGVPTTDVDSSGSVYDQAIGTSLDLHVKEIYKFLVRIIMIVNSEYHDRERSPTLQFTGSSYLN